MAAKRLLTAFLAASLLALSVSCGHTGNRTDTNVGATHASPAGEACLAPTVPLADVLKQIDAYPTPKDVSAKTWTTLKDELKRLLIARSKDGKTLSIAPVGTLCEVTDLAATSNTAGTQATLTWTEALAGDCDNDGQVFISDLQPIAAHYGETSTGPGSPAYLADANGDGQVFITDLQPVAADYGMHLQGYQVLRGHWNGTSTDWETTPRPNPNAANPDWSVDRPSPPPATSRPTYSYTDDLTSAADKANVRYVLLAYGDGAMGAQSNEAVMPPPAYFAVSGTVTESGTGLAGVTLTLTPGGLNAKTQADGTYSIAGVQDGTYTLTPSKIAYVFAPSSLQVTVSDADVSGNDFTATSHPLAESPWPKFHADARNTGQSAYVGAQTNTVRWTYTGIAGEGSASIAPDGTVYANTGTDGDTYALNPGDGSLKWKTFTAGGDCTPAVGLDGTVYTEGVQNGVVYALNPIDGSVKWQRDVGNGSSSSPAIATDGTVYVGAHAPLYGAYGFYALNPSDGTVKWKAVAGKGVDSSPAIGPDGTIYVGSGDHNVYAFDPADGSVKWSYLTGGTVLSSPAIGTDGTVYVGSTDGNMYALNGADGSVKWTYGTGANGYVRSSPAVAPDGTLFFEAFDYPNGTVYAVNSVNGTLKWTFNNQGETQSAALGADGTIYIGGGNTVDALNPQDGSLKWQYQTHDQVTSSPAIAADGTVYVACSVDGIVNALYAFWP